MPCHPIVDADGKIAGFICGPGGYKHLVRASCPWCCLGKARTIHGTRLVHGGYCAPDMLCGRCGQYWSADDDHLRRMKVDEREKNLRTVRDLKRAGVKVAWPEVQF